VSHGSPGTALPDHHLPPARWHRRRTGQTLP